MLRASVLIPTHEHAATLPFAVKSVQSQGIDEIEILIVGDGVDGTLRAVIERLCADDARINSSRLFRKQPKTSLAITGATVWETKEKDRRFRLFG